MWIKTKIINFCESYKCELAEINAKNISTAILHQKTFPRFRNYCQGRSLVICGAGPTLQDYKPIEGAVHIALNRSFMFENIKFDFIFAQDYEGIRMIENELVDYEGNNCVKLFGFQEGSRKDKEIPHSLAARCNALRFNTDLYIHHNGYKSKFVYDIDSRPLGNMPNVGLSVMQFALYMNPDKLYIVGCDMGIGHFTNCNMSEEEVKRRDEELKKIWTGDEYYKTIEKWKECRAFAGLFYPETKIISVNPVGLKGIFEDWYQNK